MPVLSTEAVLPLPREEVFPFFAKAENLERITPDSLRFRIVSPLPIRMEEGALIDYRLKVGGLPQRWRTRISLWDPPNRFADEQIKGPYKKWFHTHTFEECEEGTRMIDRVEYELPFQPFGNWVHPLIRRQLRAIFTYRNAHIGEYFSIPGGKGVVRGPVKIEAKSSRFT